MAVLCLHASSCKKDDAPATPGTEEPDESRSGGDATTDDFSENAFGHEVTGLTGSQLDDFAAGNSFFRNNWVVAPASATARDGLGPMLNSLSCGGCHHKDGRAAPPAFASAPLNGLLFRISIPGTSATGGPMPHPEYGLQLNNRAIAGVTPEGSADVTYTEVPGQYLDGTAYSLRRPSYTFTDEGYGSLAGVLYSPRIAAQVMGLGLLEGIPEADILAHADEADANGDGISGRANRVWNFSESRAVVGRFGWKANQPNILQQTAAAFHGDIGITNPLFPTENLTATQAGLYGALPSGGNPEISAENLQRVIFYMRALAVPARRNATDATVKAGAALFRQVGCNGCHVTKFTTGASDIAALANQTIHPYTDLLLHDMGDDLADGRPDFLATGREWRTPPLWGIGLLQTVNGHTFLLHDGRARNAEEAILWHGGEASSARDRFKNLSAPERASVLRFLESL